MTALERLRNWNTETATILGSDLNSIVPGDAQAIPNAQFQELPQMSVSGRVGQFVLSKIDNHSVIFAQDASICSGERTRPRVLAMATRHRELFQNISARAPK
jgi:hypothetical protein